MSRKQRYVPKLGTLVETTCRVIQGRMLLRPSRVLNEMIAGTLAVAKRRYGVRIICVVVLSNHFHLLLEVDDAGQLARFQGFVCSKIAREVSRVTGWKEKVWGRRYAGIVVSEEPEAQVERLRYLLSHGVKENLVGRCADWPGVHAAEALITGRPLVGYWFDRTAEYHARRRGEDFGAYTFATPEALTFDGLPCWQHLSEADYRVRVAEMVKDIEAQAAAERNEQGLEPLGPDTIRRQDPDEKPKRIKRSPAPLVHAATRATRLAFREAYRQFVSAYRAAAEKLRAGERNVVFPDGSFPPALPFVQLQA